MAERRIFRQKAAKPAWVKGRVRCLVTRHCGVLGQSGRDGHPVSLPSIQCSAMHGLARQLLAEAGYPHGFKTTMLPRMGSQFERISVFLKGELAKIGIAAALDVKETASAPWHGGCPRTSSPPARGSPPPAPHTA